VWESETPVEMGICLTSLSLPVYPQEKDLPICQGVGGWAWSAAGPLPGFPGQKGKIWEILLASDAFT